MKGCWPQLSFPICSQTSRASPPMERNQSFRLGPRRMYLMGSQKSWRNIGSARKLQSSSSRSNLRLRSGTSGLVGGKDWELAGVMETRKTTVRIGKNRIKSVRATSVRFASDGVDLGNVAAWKLHDGSVPVFGCIWSNQNLNPSCLGLR